MMASREIALLRAALLGANTSQQPVEPCSSNRTRTVLYRAAGAASGLTVQCDVYRPDTIHDEGQSGLATEVDQTGTYHFTFVSDGPGWFVIVSDSDGGGAVKTFD